MKPPSLKGERFGMLTIIDHPLAAGGLHRSNKVRVRCDCGNELGSYLPRLTSGGTKSCGCYLRMTRDERARALPDFKPQRQMAPKVTLQEAGEFVGGRWFNADELEQKRIEDEARMAKEREAEIGRRLWEGVYSEYEDNEGL